VRPPSSSQALARTLAHSPAALFSFARHDAAPTLELPESSLLPFQVVLRHLYTDDLPTDAEMRSMAADIMAEAQRLGLHRLSLSCQRFLESSLSPSTVLPLLEGAEATGAEPLMAACLRCVRATVSQALARCTHWHFARVGAVHALALCTRWRGARFGTASFATASHERAGLRRPTSTSYAWRTT